MNKRLSRVVLLVLVTSVALNVYLLVTRGGSARRGAARRSRASVARRQADCCRGLARCQRQRWARALGALQGRKATHPTPRPVTTSKAAGPPFASTPTVGPEDQQAALCAVALETLRRDWTAKGDELTRSLRKSLADQADQEKGLQHEVKRFNDALSLTPADRDRLETHYRPIRNKRIAEALAALEEQPPDWHAVHQAAGALWTDQDRLIKELFGSDTVPRLRQAELRNRTVVLALIAAQAGLDWKHAITW